MPKKPKFKPKIKKVKLNPEQAVLACTCYADGYIFVSSGKGHTGNHWLCDGKSLPYGSSWDSYDAIS